MFQREQQWHEEQEQLLDVLHGIEKEKKAQVQLAKKWYFYSVVFLYCI